MTKDKLIEYSQRVLTAKDDITLLSDSFEDLKTQVTYKFNEDTSNRSILIDQIALPSALTLEFRNIYGIEAPFYRIRDCKLGLDISGINSLGAEDYFIDFKDIPELLYAAMYDDDKVYSYVYTGVIEDDTTSPADKQNFFVDSDKKSEYTKFEEPFCPPGLNKWAGSYLYDKICKAYFLTEKKMRDYFVSHYKSSATITLPYTFTSSNPFKYNIGADANIASHNYQYTNLNNDKLYKEYINEDETYSISEGTDSNPVVYYTFTERVISIPHYVPQPEPTPGEDPPEPEIDYYIYEYPDDPFIPNDNTDTSFAHYEFGNLSSGIALLHKHPDDDPLYPEQGLEPVYQTTRRIYIDIISQTNPLIIPLSQTDWQRKYSYLYSNNRFIKSGSTATITFSEPEESEIVSSIISFSKNRYSDVLSYYEIYKGLGKLVDPIEVDTSISTMQGIIDSTDDTFLSKLNERISYVYNNEETTIPAFRAKNIDKYMLNAKDTYKSIFSLVTLRISKTVGTLRELFRIVENINLSARFMFAKKKNLLPLLNLVKSFTIEDGFNTDKAKIYLNNWEAPASILSAFSKGETVYAISDYSFIQYTIKDISQLDDITFLITLSDNLPGNEKNLRLVKSSEKVIE